MTDRMTSNLLLNQSIRNLAGRPRHHFDPTQNAVSLNLIARATLSTQASANVAQMHAESGLPAAEADIIRAVAQGRRV